MKTIDLHTHSTVSDGTYCPEDLIHYAAKKGLSAVALTDHDTIDGLERAAITASAYENLELINGIEISVTYMEREIHILGLFINKENKRLHEFLDEMLAAREKRNVTTIKKMQENGMDVTMEELLELRGESKLLTRIHIGNLLIKKGYAADINDAFNKYLYHGSPSYVARELVLPEKAIEVIHEAGGLAFMAHPTQYHTAETQLLEIIRQFIKMGLNGIEALYPTHSAEKERFFKETAEKYGLMISGGSDFHGSNKKGLDLGSGYGSLSIPYSILENIQKKRC